MSSFDQSAIVFPINVAGALTVANGTAHIPVPCNADLVAVYANANTAPTGASLNLRLNKNGASALTLNIAAGANKASSTIQFPINSGSAGVDDSQPNYLSGLNYIYPEMPNATALASFVPGDTISLDVTQVGSTVAGSDLSVTLLLVKR
jgi:hypothetical protein